MNKIETEITYVSYRRKSTDDERQVLSLDSQEGEIKKQFSNLKITELPPESVSAFKPYKRPVFKQMVEMIEAGKVQGIVAWHPDRLARNPMEAAQIIYLLDTGKLKDLKFCSYHFNNSPEGKMFLQMTMCQSKYSSDKLSEDVSRGMNTKATTSGYRPGHVPLGFVNSKINIRGEETISSDSVRYALVKQLWEYMLTGNYSVPQILKIADDLHLTQFATPKRPERPLTLNVLYNIFTNPFYYGWYEWKGEWIKGKHEAMITEAEFDQVQKILGRIGKPRPKEHKFAFTGLMRCGQCGSMVTADEKWKRQDNGNTHHYIYYHCSKSSNRKGGEKCLEKYVEIKEFNKQVDKILDDLHISDRFQKWALHNLHEIRKDEAKSKESSLETAQAQLSRINKQLDNLVMKYTSPENSDGSIFSDSEYKLSKGSLIKQKSALEQALQVQGKEKVEWVELSERTFNFARYAKMWFEKGDHNTRRAIFACLGSHLILKDQKVSLTLRKPFQIIFERASQAEEELLRLEPLLTTENIIDYRLVVEKIPVWSG